MYTGRQFRNEAGNRVSRQVECGARHFVRMKDERKNETTPKELFSIQKQANLNNITQNVKPKNLFQLMAVNPLPPGLSSDIVKPCKVWAGRMIPLTGNVYYSKIVLPQSNIKTNLLAKIASIAATAGKNPNISNAMLNRNWTNAQNQMGIPANPMIDPCRIRLRAGKKNNRIEAEWHFGGYNQGYVMMIRDNSASGNKSARLTRNDHNYAVAHTGTNSRSGIDLYSERHAQNPGRILLNSANDVTIITTNNNRSEAWDAHTKLLGEGARWNFVRGNVTRIKEDTYIGTWGNNGVVQNPGIQFRHLWCCWGSVFNKKFGISNAVVRNELLNRNPWITSNNQNVGLVANTNLQNDNIMV